MKEEQRGGEPGMQDVAPVQRAGGGSKPKRGSPRSKQPSLVSEGHLCSVSAQPSEGLQLNPVQDRTLVFVPLSLYLQVWNIVVF